MLQTKKRSCMSRLSKAQTKSLLVAISQLVASSFPSGFRCRWWLSHEKLAHSQVKVGVSNWWCCEIELFLFILIQILYLVGVLLMTFDLLTCGQLQQGNHLKITEVLSAATSELSVTSNHFTCAVSTTFRKQFEKFLLRSGEKPCEAFLLTNVLFVWR